MPSDNYVTISQLNFAHFDREIFKDVSINIKRGKITAIMGPSGTGKTTLLRLIGAQLCPDAGKVIVNGHDIHQLSTKDLYQARRKMGLMFQSSALFTNMTVFDNVAFPLREHSKLNDSMLRDIVMMKLEAVGLRGAFHLYPRELSGGMARRVALARAIALDPALIMYDEPFTGQDPISMGILVKLIKQFNQVLGMTSVIVSHDVKETFSIADHVYILSEGKVVAEGTPEALIESDLPQAKQFIHGLPDGVVPFHYPAKKYSEDLLDG